jgi:hypothetical protein
MASDLKEVPEIQEKKELINRRIKVHYERKDELLRKLNKITQERYLIPPEKPKLLEKNDLLLKNITYRINTCNEWIEELEERKKKLAGDFIKKQEKSKRSITNESIFTKLIEEQNKKINDMSNQLNEILAIVKELRLK